MCPSLRWLPLVAVVLACGSASEVVVCLEAEDQACTATGPYLACGCGCCGGVEPMVHCLQPGEDLCELAAQDAARAQNPNCAMTGCSMGVLYKVCDDGTVP